MILESFENSKAHLDSYFLMMFVEDSLAVKTARKVSYKCFF